jgi:NTE family protein
MSETAVHKVIGLLFDGLKSEKYDIGLVLSGGAARGFAHGGVLKAMEEKSLHADIVSGVSAGSIVGSFYCDGYSAEEILEIFVKNKVFELVKLRFNKKGILNISGLKKVLKNNLRTKRIEDLPTPLVITATNIEEGITSYFTEGDLVDTVLASCSIPILFVPTLINNINYIDGGVTNNFPVEPLEGICKKLIGCNVNTIGPFNPKKGIMHMAMHTFHISIASGIEIDKEKIDYFIEPEKLKDYSYYNIKYGKEMYQIGYDEAMKVFNKDY